MTGQHRAERSTRRPALIEGLVAALLVLVACTSGTQPTPSSDAGAAATPAAKPKPASSAAPVGASATRPPADTSLWGQLTSGALLTPLLIVLGVALTSLSALAWVRANRADWAPDTEQLEQIRRFVEGHFARYVAHGLVSAGYGAEAGGASPGRPSVSTDEAWRRVFLEQLDFHSELNHLSKRRALGVYTAHIDDAVAGQIAAARSTAAAADNLPPAPPSLRGKGC